MFCFAVGLFVGLFFSPAGFASRVVAGFFVGVYFRFVAWFLAGFAYLAGFPGFQACFAGFPGFQACFAGFGARFVAGGASCCRGSGLR
ncbi:hypothetical protein AB0368_18265 [Actinoplanes sp. NPDC051475]|uniref:hypothetical protein n=1 Tax=Actinoplanes sp. NPDC051475 TaxID=3157225 RepID=UPI00344D7855